MVKPHIIDNLPGCPDNFRLRSESYIRITLQARSTWLDLDLITDWSFAKRVVATFSALLERSRSTAEGAIGGRGVQGWQHRLRSKQKDFQKKAPVFLRLSKLPLPSSPSDPGVRFPRRCGGVVTIAGGHGHGQDQPAYLQPLHCAVIPGSGGHAHDVYGGHTQLVNEQTSVAMVAGWFAARDDDVGGSSYDVATDAGAILLSQSH
ncbi:unnamed protein product [Urochloa humidicola]